MREDHQTAESLDRRNRQRVYLGFPVRYMLADRSEHAGNVLDASAASISISGERRGIIGEKVIAYAEGVGRIEGTVVRHLPRGFAMNIGRGSSRAAATLERLVFQHQGTQAD